MGLVVKRLAVVVASALVVGVAVLGGWAAHAGIPGTDGTVHGCYLTADPGKGSLYVIDSSDTCPAGYTALNWNQTGSSTAGSAGLDVVTVMNSANAGTSASIDCPGDHPHLLGGGGVATDFGDESTSQLVESRPISAAGPSVSNPHSWNPANVATGWYVQASKANLYTSAYAICSK